MCDAIVKLKWTASVKLHTDRRFKLAQLAEELGPAPRPNLGMPPGFRPCQRGSTPNIETPHGELTTMAPRAVFDTEQVRDKARKDLLHLLEGVS